MVSEKKKALVQKLTKSIQTYPVVALVNMQNLPAKQLQNMRKQLLKKSILISMARKKLLQLALKNSQKQNIGQLIEKMKGIPALLLAKENPFTLYSILQKNKSSAPAKPNQTAPRDIAVPAGPTNFAPGPIISELASVGIKTKVEGGKLVIVQDTVVAKENDVISLKLAELLKRLDIQPMEIGLDLVAAWENDLVFEAKQLHIDEVEYFNNVILAFQEAFNLSVEAAYPTKDNVELLLQKAFQESKSLALEGEILTDLTKEEVLAKVEQQALSLKEAAKVETVERPKEEQPKEEKKEEAEKPKTEEKKEEIKEEVKEEPKEEKEEPKQEEFKEEEPVKEEKPVEEKKEVEKEEPKEPETTEDKAPEEPKPEPKEKAKAEDIPSAVDLIKATKEKFAEAEPEKKEEVVEVKTSAEEMIKATREEFDPNLAKEPQPSAEELVAKEKKEAEKEVPKEDEEVKEAESLLEKLKKQGTLREK